MTLVAIIPLEKAEALKAELQEKGLVDRDYRVKKEDNVLLIPVKEKFTKKDISFKEVELEPLQKKTLKSEISNLLTEQEQEHLKTAFDSVGTIAILEIDEILEPKEKQIANLLLETTPGIKTVLKKVGIHKGTFRTQDMQLLAGEDTKETIHKENDIRLKLNVEQVYFSPRLANERKRIANLVQKGEDILVMFSGCAPYPVVLAKHTQAKQITGVEINPTGHKYGLENLRLNRINNVTLINGDVNEEVPKLNSFDRILMPLPKSAEDFLPTALKAAKKGTIIHFYAFLQEKEFQIAYDQIDQACKSLSINYELLDTIKCGHHAPYVYRICVDVKIK